MTPPNTSPWDEDWKALLHLGRDYVQKLSRRARTPEQRTVVSLLKPIPFPNQYRYFSVVLTALIAVLYIFLIVHLDNTNIGTTNGLWKSPDVAAWAHGTGAPIDDGEYLYAKWYGHLTTLLPDRWLHYGVPAPDITFRKMAILNGIFGAIASGLVFLLSLRFTASLGLALTTAVVHAGAAFILLNSLNSEDIIPGYTFFLAFTVCFFEFLYTAKRRFLIMAALFLALATLFHWTLMVPAVGALVFVCLIFLLGRRTSIVKTAVLLLACFLAFARLLVFVSMPSLDTSVARIVLPTKAGGNGWVGFFGEKLGNASVGIGNYLSGGQNFSNYKAALANSTIYHSMLLSWAFAGLVLGVCFVVLLRRRQQLDVLALAAFCLALFFVGELGAIYSQPQDPQMQIQPLFASIAGLLVCFRSMPRLRPGGRSAIVLVVFAGAIWNGEHNFTMIGGNPGDDSQALKTLQDMNALFPKDNTVIVSLGFEGWTTWRWLELCDAKIENLLARNFHTARPFTAVRGISGKDAAAVMSRQIDDAFSKNLRVVASSIWPGSVQDAVGSLATVAPESEALVYVTTLRSSYRVVKSWDTTFGPGRSHVQFVELAPAAKSSPNTPKAL